MSQFFNGLHFMVDLETTGLNPHLNRIWQMAAVPFYFKQGAGIVNLSDHAGFVFNAFVKDHDPERTMDNQWENWAINLPAYWSKFQYSSQIGVAPAVMLADFESYCRITADNAARAGVIGEGLTWHFWCKPSHFDWAFLKSYADKHGHKLPFHYRNIIDLHSFIQGLASDTFENKADVEGILNTQSKLATHDASADAIDQLITLQKFWAAVRHAQAEREA